MTFSSSLPSRWSWLSNSAFNLIGGASATLVTLVLPAVLVRSVPSDEFAIWSLSFQLIAYFSIFGLGMQVAVASQVARASRVDKDASFVPVGSVVASGRRIALLAALAATLLVGLAAAIYPRMFPAVPEDLLPTFSLTVALFGIASLAGNLAQVEMGYFQGLHANRVFIVRQVGVRAIAVAAVSIAAGLGFGIAVVAAAFAVSMASLMPLMRLALRDSANNSSSIVGQGPDRDTVRRLLTYGSTMTVWTVSMAVISTAAVLTTGVVDFEAVEEMSLAMAVSMAVPGILGAALTPMITLGAAMAARADDRQELPRLLSRTTSITVVALICVLAVSIAAGKALLTLWLGETLATRAYPLAILLISAQCVRNIAAPYASLLLATGLHGRAQLSVICEALVTVGAASILGSQLGATGVAIGVVVGSCSGLILGFALNLNKTPELSPQPLKFLGAKVLWPALLCAPLIGLSLLLDTA